MKKLFLLLIILALIVQVKAETVSGNAGGFTFKARARLNLSPETVLFAFTYGGYTQEYYLTCSIQDSLSFHIERYVSSYSELFDDVLDADSSGLLMVDSIYENYWWDWVNCYYKFTSATCPVEVKRLCFDEILDTKVIIHIVRTLSPVIPTPKIEHEIFGIDIYDFNGKYLLKHSFDEGIDEADAFSFLHQNLPAGIYILAMKYEEEVVYRKIGLNYGY